MLILFSGEELHMSIHSFEHYPPTDQESQPIQPDTLPQLSAVPTFAELAPPPSETETDDRADREEQQRRRMLQDFYDFAKETHDTDIKSAESRQEHDVALVVHSYAWSRATRHIEKTQERAKVDPSYTQPDLRLLDYERINKRINYHYRQYGKDRTVINRVTRREEETFLLSAKERATAIIYDKQEKESDYVHLQPEEGRRGIPRHQRYPEILLVMELREALIADRAYVAAKSAEITFAAYGSIFPALVRERAIRVLDDAGAVRRLIKKIEAAELPKDELPDKPQHRKPKA